MMYLWRQIIKRWLRKLNNYVKEGLKQALSEHSRYRDLVDTGLALPSRQERRGRQIADKPPSASFRNIDTPAVSHAKGAAADRR